MGKTETSPPARCSEDGTQPKRDAVVTYWIPGADFDSYALLFYEYMIEYVGERRQRSILKTAAWVTAAGSARIMSCYRPHFASKNTQSIGGHIEKDQGTPFELLQLAEILEVWLLQGAIVVKVSAII